MSKEELAQAKQDRDEFKVVDRDGDGRPAQRARRRAGRVQPLVALGLRADAAGVELVRGHHDHGLSACGLIAHVCVSVCE